MVVPAGNPEIGKFAILNYYESVVFLSEVVPVFSEKEEVFARVERAPEEAPEPREERCRAKELAGIKEQGHEL